MFRRGLVTLHIWEVKASWEHTELTGSVTTVIFFKTYLSMGHFTVLFHMGFSSCSFYLLPCLCLVDIIFNVFYFYYWFFTYSFNMLMLFNLFFIVYL